MTVLSAPTIKPSPLQLRFAVKLTLPCTTSPHAGFVMGAFAAAAAVCCCCCCAIRGNGWIAKPLIAARDTIVATMYDISVRFIPNDGSEINYLCKPTVYTKSQIRVYRLLAYIRVIDCNYV